MLQKYAHIVVLFFVFVVASAQDTEETIVEDVGQMQKTPTDSLVLTEELLQKNNVTNHKLYECSFEKDFQKKYTGEEFNYSKTKPRISLWEKFKRSIGRFLEKIFPKSLGKDINKITIGILYIFYAIILGVVIFILLKVFKNKEGNWFFSKKKTVVNPEVNPLEEDIHEIDFPAMISQYERAGDYRMAVRYQFLLALKILTDKGKINWHIEKTNSDYLKEFTDANDKKQFEKIAYIFDYIWYGEFPIDEPKYKSLIPEFQFFKNDEI